jgi:hypothetical protein
MIAFVAGFFALYQLRAVPGERRRRILDAMVKQYADTSNERGRILKECPVLLRRAYKEVQSAIESEIALKESPAQDQSPEEAAAAGRDLRHLGQLQREAVIWTSPDIGISYTSAAEILSSEFKLRALLWCIEMLRQPDLRQRLGYTDDLMGLCASLVRKLNNFALDYENGTYPPRTLLGQLHRSIAATVKPLEPIIWERSVNGRWGRRVLRLGLAAEHFNDVVKIHRSNDLVWESDRRPEDGVVVHPALTIDAYGNEILRVNIPEQPQFLPVLRLQVKTFYWWLIGKAEVRPRSPLWAYGGTRLRRHERHEDRLSAFLRYGFDNLEGSGRPISLTFTWTLSGIRESMIQEAKTRKSALQGGPIRWLYQRNASR